MNRIKIAAISAAAVFLFSGAAVFLIDYTVRTSSAPKIVTADKAGDGVILILGAQVKSGGRVSHILHDRLATALEIHKKNPSLKIIVSGDHGTKHYDEVSTMKKFLLAGGVNPGMIFLDHAGFNTYDSLYRAKNVFNVKKIIIVTQGYHLYRAIYIATIIGLDAKGVPADKRTYVKIQYFKFREVAARVKDFFLVNVIKPESKFVGPAISIEGDGRITH